MTVQFCGVTKTVIMLRWWVGNTSWFNNTAWFKTLVVLFLSQDVTLHLVHWSYLPYWHSIIIIIIIIIMIIIILIIIIFVTSIMIIFIIIIIMIMIIVIISIAIIIITIIIIMIIIIIITFVIIVIMVVVSTPSRAWARTGSQTPALGRPASPPTRQAAQLPPRGPSTNPRPLV